MIRPESARPERKEPLQSAIMPLATGARICEAAKAIVKVAMADPHAGFCWVRLIQALMLEGALNMPNPKSAAEHCMASVCQAGSKGITGSKAPSDKTSKMADIARPLGQVAIGFDQMMGASNVLSPSTLQTILICRLLAPIALSQAMIKVI